jgi:hypothetical protein
MTIPLNWYTRTVSDNALVDLFDPGLSELTAAGIYLIYRPAMGGLVSLSPVVIRVGQGQIGERLLAHQKEAAIIAQSLLAPRLKVAWAVVAPELIDSAERFLADRYRPLVGGAVPHAEAIAVTLPFAA